MKKKRGEDMNTLKKKKNVKANNTRKKKKTIETQERKRGSHEFKATALTLNQPQSGLL